MIAGATIFGIKWKIANLAKLLLLKEPNADQDCDYAIESKLPLS
jgi:hypothetical protein